MGPRGREEGSHHFRCEVRRLAVLALALLPALCLNARRVDFAVMSDLHVASGSRSAADLSACIKDINSLQGQPYAPSFVIVSGDLTDFGSDVQIEVVRNMLDSLTVPYYAIPGNHDAKWSESGCNTFGRVFDGEDFLFEAGGYRFVGCASGPDMRMAPALIPRQHVRKLEELAKGEKKPTIFFNHYPLDSCVLNYGGIRALLREMDTRVVISGHWHINRTMDYCGLPGIVCRSTMSKKDMAPGYTLATIEDGILSVREKTPGDARCGNVWASVDLDAAVPGGETLEHGIPGDYPWMGFDVNERYSSVKELWRIEEDANIASGFAVDGRGRAFYATETGTLKCLRLGRRADDASRFECLWTVDLPGKVFSTPLYASGKVILGCADGGVYAFGAKDGRLIWRAETGKSVLASPVRLGRRIFIGASDGCFRALRLRNGREIWNFDGVDGFVECRPFVDRSQVVFGSWGKKLYSLDPRDGTVQWIWEVNRGSVMYSPAACWPVKADGKVFVAVPDRKVHVLDAASGNELAVIDGGREAVGISGDGKTVFAKTMPGHVYAVSASDPTEKIWDVKTCLGYDISPSSLLECDGVLFVPSDKGSIIALDAADGSLMWAHKLSVALVNPMTLLPGRRLLVSTLDGVVCLLQF